MLSCIKFVTILYNFVFWLIGVCILGLSGYLWWDSQNYRDITEVSKYYVTPMVLLLILGLIMTVVGFLGCCGAVRESRCFLGLYFLFCLTLCIACGATLYWANQSEDTVRYRMKIDTTTLILSNYGSGTTNATEILVDRIQREFTCCGSQGPEDWAKARYNNNSASAFERGISVNVPDQKSYRIPVSCCRPNSTPCIKRVQQVGYTDMLNLIDGLYQEGCMKKFERFVQEKWHFIFIVGFVLIGIQVLALLFACIFCCAISRWQDNEDD